MARIGLIEITARNHELSGLCKIASTGRNDVTVFTTPDIFSHAEEELWGNTQGYEWVLREEGESNRRFLKRVQDICDQRIDVLVAKTFRDLGFVFFKPRCRLVAFLDDLNHWFRDTKSLSVYLKNLIRMNFLAPSPRTNTLVGPVLRRLMLSHLDAVIVEYPPFEAHLRDVFGYQGRVFFLPNRSYEGAPPPRDDECVRFVVPGMISEARRDYRLLASVFEKLFARHGDSIGLDLVGEPIGEYGRGIVSRLRESTGAGYDVYCPSEYVPARVVEEKLNQADFIVSPLQVGYRSGPIQETYTITKPTGIFSDTIKYAKPCVVPHTYRVTEEFTTSFLTYRGEDDLEALLDGLITDADRRRKLQEEAVRNSEKFSLEKMQANFDKMVEELLSGQ